MGMITPYDWQLPAVDDKVRILTRGDFCPDASDTGTGKTVTALAAAMALDRPVLVVCPKAVHTAWERTAEAMGCARLITGGVGISLHQSPGRRPRVSFLTPGDKADDYKQCLGRINRAGGGYSTQTVVLAAGTVEEKVQRNLAMKLGNLDALQDGDVEIN